MRGHADAKAAPHQTTRGSRLRCPSRCVSAIFLTRISCKTFRAGRATRPNRMFGILIHSAQYPIVLLPLSVFGNCTLPGQKRSALATSVAGVTCPGNTYCNTRAPETPLTPQSRVEKSMARIMLTIRLREESAHAATRFSCQYNHTQGDDGEINSGCKTAERCFGN